MKLSVNWSKTANAIHGHLEMVTVGSDEVPVGKCTVDPICTLDVQVDN